MSHPEILPDLHEDPCLRAKLLRQSRDRIIMGEQEFEFEYRSNETTRRMRFSQGNLDLLEREIRLAEEACAAVGGPPTGRRFAITAGHRGPFP